MINILLEIWNKILTSNLFNFVLMLVFLGWIIKKCKIADMLENGRKSIEDKIISAKAEKENAIKALYEIQEQGVNVEKEVLDIIEKADKNAIIVGEKLIDDAEKQSETFTKSTQKAIDTNIEKLRLNLTNETAQIVLDKAKNHIEKLLKEDRNLHIKYINESIEALREVNI